MSEDIIYKDREGNLITPIRHFIKIADLEISSNECSLDDLIKKAKQMLKSSEIKNYLIDKKRKKIYLRKPFVSECRQWKYQLRGQTLLICWRGCEKREK
jgi:hypothetical protein